MLDLPTRNLGTVKTRGGFFDICLDLNTDRHGVSGALPMLRAIEVNAGAGANEFMVTFTEPGAPWVFLNSAKESTGVFFWFVWIEMDGFHWSSGGSFHFSGSSSVFFFSKKPSARSHFVSQPPSKAPATGMLFEELGGGPSEYLVFNFHWDSN